MRNAPHTTLGSNLRQAARMLWRCAVLALPPGAVLAQSISVDELAQRMLDMENPPLVIDVRRSHEFEQSHIPNAISIPLAALESRRLPAVGDVVVYGDGLGRTDMEQAVRLLEAKPGIDAVYLEGGFAAWEARSGYSTGAKGFQKPEDGFITYQQLVATGGKEVVLYDLRKGGRSARNSSSLTDHFPQARVGRGSPYALLHKPSGGSAAVMSAGEKGGAANPLIREGAVLTGDLIVLVDDDNETAAKVAQRLRAAGYSRVQVLAGGELIMDFEGRPGLERQGGGSIRIAPGGDAGAEGKPNSQEGRP